MSIAAVAAAIAAGRSGAASIRDGHMCSGAVSGSGWSGLYHGGAERCGLRNSFSRRYFEALVVLSGSVVLFCVASALFFLEREGEERERERAVLRRSFNIPFGDSAEREGCVEGCAAARF